MRWQNTDRCESCTLRQAGEAERPTRVRPSPRSASKPLAPDGRRRKQNADALARHREKTDNAYGKTYRQAKAAALKRLAELHPEDFRRLMDEERVARGLKPTRA